MIINDKEYEITKEWVRKFTEEVKRRKKTNTSDPLEILSNNGIEYQLRDLKNQLLEYEKTVREAGKADDMATVKDIIMLIIGILDVVPGRTRLMKYLFLVQMSRNFAKSEISIKWEPYHYGHC